MGKWLAQAMDWFERLQQDEVSFFAFSLVAVSALFVLWIIQMRFHSRKRLESLRKDFLRLEGEFEAVRNRSKTNLQMVRDVVDGFDGILQKMRTSIDEEEKKLGALPAQPQQASRVQPLAENRQQLDKEV